MLSRSVYTLQPVVQLAVKYKHRIRIHYLKVCTLLLLTVVVSNKRQRLLLYLVALVKFQIT